MTVMSFSVLLAITT